MQVQSPSLPPRLRAWSWRTGLLTSVWIVFGAWLLYDTWRATRPSHRFLRTTVAARLGPPPFPWYSMVLVALAAGVGALLSRTRLQRASAGAFVALTLVRYVVAYLTAALSVAMMRRGDPRLERHMLDAFVYTDAFVVRIVNAVSFAFAVVHGAPPLDDDSPVVWGLRRFTALVDPVSTVPMWALVVAAAFVVHGICYPLEGAIAVDPGADYLPGMTGLTLAPFAALWALCSAWTWVAHSLCRCACVCCGLCGRGVCCRGADDGTRDDEDGDDDDDGEAMRIRDTDAAPKRE